eukprot:jgi/Ulvmu1/2184/UM013_0029.1
MDDLLASVSAFMHNAVKPQPPTKKDTIMDHATRVEYPGEVCDLRGGCARLLGLGPRKLRIAGFPVDVYSVGMYARPDEMKQKLRRHRGSSPCCLAKNTDFLQDFKNPDIEKELRIVTVFRKVTKEKFWQAFQTRLTPLLTEEQRITDLSAFRCHFDGVKFRKNTEVRIAMSSGGHVATIINGNKVGSVRSPAISAALVDIYLGSEPPSAAMKADFLDTAAITLGR